MRTVSRPQARTLVPLLLTLCCFGCARPLGSEEAGKSGQSIPFRDTSDSMTSTPAAGSSLAVPGDDSAPARAVPFHVQNLPTGTLLSVRLNDRISSDAPGETANFSATLDEPVVIDRRTVLPAGAAVTGQVESAQRSSLSDNRGYVRLTLNWIEVGGRDFALSTSTLFARGEHGHRGSAVQLEQGRRLTFRLAEPLLLSGQVAISRR